MLGKNSICKDFKRNINFTNLHGVFLAFELTDKLCIRIVDSTTNQQSRSEPYAKAIQISQSCCNLQVFEHSFSLYAFYSFK